MRPVSVRPVRDISSEVTTSTGTGVSTLVRGVREPTTTIVSFSSCSGASGKSSLEVTPAETFTARSSERNPAKSARTRTLPGGTVS